MREMYEWKRKEGRSGVSMTYELNSFSMCFRETSWESRFCPWRLNRPHTWRWTSQCSASMWSIGCWVFPWKQQKHQCPSANPQRGRRFTTTSQEVRVGELVMIHACLFLESFHFKDPHFSSLCFLVIYVDGSKSAPLRQYLYTMLEGTDPNQGR